MKCGDTGESQPLTSNKIMKEIVNINWKIKDIISPKLSFKSWYAEVFKTDAPKALLSKINKKDKELEQMKKEALAARGEAAA